MNLPLATDQAVTNAKGGESPENLELTIGILSVGSAQLDNAIASLQLQDMKVNWFVVRDIQPFNKAFNQMLKNADTPYVIQLDEDMELFPNACRVMLERIKSMRETDKSVAQVVYCLEDQLLGRILGVKIFHTQSAASVLMASGHYPDREYNDNLTKAGYTLQVVRNQPMGYHARNRSPHELFVKCCITSSKTFTQGKETPLNSDLKRFSKLYNHAISLPSDQAIPLLGGLIWGLFNQVDADASAYPWNALERLNEAAGLMHQQHQSEYIDQVAQQTNHCIKSYLSDDTQVAPFDKPHYINNKYRTVLKWIVTGDECDLDILGLGHGVFPLLINMHGKLNGLVLDTSAKRRLQHPITKAIIDDLECSTYSIDEIIDSVQATDSTETRTSHSENCLIVVDNVVVKQESFLQLLDKHYKKVILDFSRLSNNGIDVEVLAARLSKSGWICKEELADLRFYEFRTT